MKAVALALLLAAPLLAGCALPVGDRCEPPYPLVLQAYPTVGDPETYTFHSALWNCTDEPIPIDEPCDGRFGIVPRVVIANETYRIGHNRTAEPAESVWCFSEGPERDEMAPGEMAEQSFRWDGTYKPDGGEPVPAPPGPYVVHVKAGKYYDSQVVEAPWRDRT